MKKIYNRLVRDKMIDIYEKDINEKITATAYASCYLSKEETLTKLKDKLLEEVTEVFDAYENPNREVLKEEIADVIEVLDAILYHNNFSLSDALAIRDKKKAKRGGFEKGLYLESIDYIDGKEPK